MKHLLVLLNLTVAFLALIFALNMYLKVTELENEVTILHTIQKKQIEELNKDIRVLRTDMDVMFYGFEGGKENGKD